MTFEDKLKEMLVECGLFEDQALAIMVIVKTDETNEPMLGRWGDDVEGYPQVILVLAWVAAKRAALKYIDANCPQAWFRPMFVPEGD